VLSISALWIADRNPIYLSEYPRIFMVPILPAALTLGPATLRVADEKRALALYENVIGLKTIGRLNGKLALGAADKPFLYLDVVAGTTPRPRRGVTGLYHVAILLPDRAALGSAISRLTNAGIKLGAADHNVSEAIYLYDADGNGLEIYRDRPREEWQWNNGIVRMGNEALDFEAILAEGGKEEPDEHVPAGTRIGHVHLQVANLAEAERFYCGVLGFVKTAGRDGALFVSAGGYHHHVGLNVWDSENAPLPPKDSAGLEEFVIDLPPAEIPALKNHIEVANIKTAAEGDGFSVRDPWQTKIRIAPIPTIG
jgi:catechol 2,3-dioxygenase